MRIVLLSAASCIHTVRWANGLASKGEQVFLITLHALTQPLDKRVIFHRLKFKAPFGYLTNIFEIKRLLLEIKPDILNTHFSTGYGFLAALTRFSPNLLSVWGSDVYDFPSKSIFHYLLLKFNLKSATAIGSTSHCMKRQTSQIYDHKYIFVTPFGVDINRFFPVQKISNNQIIIGTVKTLKYAYGIDTLIQAFSILLTKINVGLNVKLEIWGDGPDLFYLRALTKQLKIDGFVSFNGHLNHELVPNALNQMDIYVALSRQESFGVAIIEASACAIPVVVSNAEGPMEIVDDGVTGIIVPVDDPRAAAEALYKLVNSRELRHQIGRQGENHVKENYSWDYCINLMLETYKKTIDINLENR